MRDVLDWSLVYGVLPAVLSGFGVLAGVLLLARRRRTWWLRVVPLLAGAAAVVTLASAWVVDVAWRPFPDPVPWRVVAWCGVGVFAIALAIASFPGTRWWRRGGAVAAAVLVLLTCAVKINAYYGQFPTLRTVFGLPSADQVAFADNAAWVASPFLPQPGKAMLDGWVPPADMPGHGAVSQVRIPPAVSGFAARDAYVYLPPAYLTAHRPLLPVLVLLHGQPGAPVDWIDGGRLGDMMDGFASAHHGLAPVVVVADDTGTELGNPLCLDSRLGNSESYLTVDVPDWIKKTLQVDQDSRHWAVAGFSYGGTCSLQLALRRPDLFPTFVDISGQTEPTLGTRSSTVQEAFGGDESRFRAVNPADEVAARTYPGTAGMITAGDADGEYLPQQQEVYAYCRRARLDVGWLEVPGGHTWQAWGAGLERSLGWLAVRTGLVAR
ncbi:esterase [Amycolatopsis rhizosphaerae]|uniref:Esterase n=1 Tax=Amycolatopsis rhizosphaerae TaxID=2053003 RepID=A0A558AKY2_9PSEU|nr:alpha/beta hydrolase-fold protein [Amycolatopsis rhizosphaerae]TVT24861.1 esterase [Amycolatopsis rhizosphaerae]